MIKMKGTITAPEAKKLTNFIEVTKKAVRYYC